MTSDDELRRAVAKADLLLKQRQTFWEAPRGLAIVVGVAGAVIGVIAGITGYHMGSAPPQRIEATIHFDQPLQVKIVP